MHHRDATDRDQAPIDPTPAGCLSAGTGRILPDATLPTPSGPPVSLGHYHGRRNLVVILLGAAAPGHDVSRLISRLAQSRAAIHDEDAEVLVVTAVRVPESPNTAGDPFAVLIDADESLHRGMHAVNASGDLAPAVIITDRYREIYHIFRPADPAWPPTFDEVLRWLVFMNIQCPECGAPEW